MLLENLNEHERTALHAAAAQQSDGLVRDLINSMAWVRIRERWDEPVIRFWIFKTVRYRDLRVLWTDLFGPEPGGTS